MKRKAPIHFDDRFRLLWVGFVLSCFVFSMVFIARTSSANDDGKEGSQNFSPLSDPNFPREFDLRAIHGTPRGTDTPVAGLPSPSLVQLKALNALRNVLGLALDDSRLRVEFNGLTATPRHIINQDGFLSAPSNLPAEQIALGFIRKNREIFRFDENDLNNLKLTSRAKSSAGTTTLVFNQQLNGKAVYHGDVMVNVAKNGQIVSVGGESYPRLTQTNSAVISAAQAIQNAASRLNINGFTPQSLGSAQVLATYGNLPAEFVTGEKFARGTAFSSDITVTQVVFPMGSTARLAYKFTLSTPQYYGMMWQHFIDAQTGETLRRSSLTNFYGPPGGGLYPNRRGTFRPDVQDMVEAFNHPTTPTATGKVFDTLPAALSGLQGFGRAVRTAGNTFTSPVYAADGTATSPGRDFQFSMVDRRNEEPRFSQTPTTLIPFSSLPGLLGQVTRGFPDASNPTSWSPFGWFYLPTDTGGAEILAPNTNRTTTRALGYTMHANAVTRNNAVPGNANSPTANGLQPFSADLTAISSTNLADGRTLNSVFQSDYTEGNNVLAADDKDNDDEATNGVKGFSNTRNFTGSLFDYYALYEFDNTAAAEATDVPPGAVNLFYVNNVIHDYMYSVGFTEQFWNFQMDNFGKGGAGGDYVIAQVQDGSGTNNANFGTPDDGGAPRMQMYRFTETASFGRRSDGDFDFDVIAHEHYHGISNRSAGKGATSCLGIALVGESGGMGEGWGDFIAASMTDDDAAGEYVTGQQDVAIRRLPLTNYRWSYNSVNGTTLNVRRLDPLLPTAPDANPGAIPFEVHDIGELWASTLWDMRELMIVKDPNGVFFDGTRRLGGGTSFYIGNRQVQSVDTYHPISYRSGFLTSSGLTPTLNPLQHIVRPSLVANEINTVGNRQGPLATAVSRGGRLADQITLRGLQLAPCNPSFVEMRDSMLAADSELTGGENRAIIWRAFASHGVGQLARSTGGTGGTDIGGGAQSAPTIVENFDVPADVAACETSGPIAAPTFSLANTAPNTVTLTINGGSPVPNASSYIIARSTSAGGPFATIATIPASQTTFNDNDGGAGLNLGQAYYYQVHAARNPQCIGTANVQNITIVNGVAISPAPVFFGIGNVSDPRTGNSLTLSWTPATSGNPTAAIVYDVYRVPSITTASGMNDSTTAPTFTPSAANRITPAGGITATSYNDGGRLTGQVYYYIVQARDTNNGKIDTNNTGNRAAKFNAPTTNSASSTPFAIENFEAASANNRFTPPLTDTASPTVSTPVWQRAAASDMLFEDQIVATTAMYAPDFDPDPPGDGTGAPSDIGTFIGPLTLNQGSVLEFDSKHISEFAFDGGTIEIAVGPTFNASPFPDNVTTFDANYFIIDNGYTGKLDGTLAGPVILSPLQGRFSFTGTRSTSHIRVALGSFAAGGAQNPGGLPVYIRFRQTSDVGTSPGAGAGWYIDNLVVKNYAPPTAAAAPVAGRITDGSGEGVEGVKVSLLDSDTGEMFAVTTNNKGFYEFEAVPVGRSYVITPASKAYDFEPSSKVVSHMDAEKDVDFVAVPKSKTRTLKTVRRAK